MLEVCSWGVAECCAVCVGEGRARAPPSRGGGASHANAGADTRFTPGAHRGGGGRAGGALRCGWGCQECRKLCSELQVSQAVWRRELENGLPEPGRAKVRTTWRRRSLHLGVSLCGMVHQGIPAKRLLRRDICDLGLSKRKKPVITFAWNLVS